MKLLQFVKDDPGRIVIICGFFLMVLGLLFRDGSALSLSVMFLSTGLILQRRERH
ncbi:hypothetical protein [Thermococcus sp. LS1]|uniref:hypothetical protein n=1 Tax=Thermococcus sp. LS1 TaxID=1638259 RepID=UPI00143A426F|nr:hypothetical protein [Thermococcus sp. LS1]